MTSKSPYSSRPACRLLGVLACIYVLGLFGGCGSPASKPQNQAAGSGNSGPQMPSQASAQANPIAVLEIETAVGDRILQHAACVDSDGLFLSITDAPEKIETAKSLRLHLSPFDNHPEPVAAEVVNCRLGYVICVQAKGDGPFEAFPMGEAAGLAPRTQVDVFDAQLHDHIHLRSGNFDRAAYQKPSKASDVIRMNNGYREQMGAVFFTERHIGRGLPILNAQGEVVGLGRGVGNGPANFCASISDMKKWLSTTQVSLVDRSVSLAEASTPRSYQFLLRAPESIRSKSVVELEIFAPYRKPRKFQIKAQRGARFTAVTLLPKEGLRHQIRAEYEGAIVEGFFQDRKIAFGDSERFLSEFSSFDSHSKNARLTSGENLAGAIRSGALVEVDVGDASIPLSLDSASSLEIKSSESDAATARYHLRVVTDGKTTAESMGAFDIRADVQAKAEATPIAPAADAPAANPAENPATAFAPELSIPIPKESLRPRYPLPSILKRVTPAGRGKYLLLYFDRLRMISVFDVAKLKIAYSVSASDDVTIIGSADQLVVVDRANSEIRAIDLETGTLRNRAVIPSHQVIGEAQAGICSTGPALALIRSDGRPGAFGLINLQTLDIRAPLTFNDSVPQFSLQTFHAFRASGDGKAFVSSSMHQSFDSVSLLLLDAQDTVTATTNNRACRQTISFCGARVFGSSGETQLYRNPSVRENYSQDDDPNRLRYWFRTYHPAFALKLGGDPKWEFTLFSLNDQQDIIGMPPPEALFEKREAYHHFAHSNLCPDERLHCYPGMNLLITIPPSSDELRIEEFNWQAAYQKPQSRYFFVTSAPPARVRRGEVYRYQIHAICSEENLAYALSNDGSIGSVGPPEAQQEFKLSPEGEFTWNVPMNAPLGRRIFRVQAIPPDGVSFHHSFTVEIVR